MSNILLATKKVYDKDLSLKADASQHICGMTSKTWETKSAYPEIEITADLSDKCMTMLIEPLVMHQRPEGDSDITRSEIFNNNISLMKDNPALKIAWSEEQELVRWRGKQRDQFLSLCNMLVVCNNYLQKQLSVYTRGVEKSILRTPINDEFYKPAEKKSRKIIAMGRICTAKNVEGVIQLFSHLPDNIEKVYIGNQLMWGVAPNQLNTDLERRLQKVVDRWIPLASREEVAKELSTALGYFNVSIYDVGCLSFLESAMSGCHCFAWKFHPMFDEYTACHRFVEYKEGAKRIVNVFDKSEGKADMNIRKQVHDWHSYASFRKQLNSIILQIMAGEVKK